MATATPATLAEPTREAAETVKARNAEIPCLPFSISEGDSVIERNISGMRRICTAFVHTVNQTPAIHKIAMTKYQ